MKQKEFLIISITVFLTVVAWIVADIYHISSTEKVKLRDTAITQPIQISIDSSVFDVLMQKR